MIGLAATPEVSLADEPVRIRAWGLPPQTAITLRAWVRDEKGDIFHSRAFYQTDTEGKVDLEQSEATGGDFRGIYPMGLFWALKPTTPYRRLIKWDVMGSPFLVHLELYPSVLLVPSEDHLPAVTTVVERWYVAPGVQRLQVRDGRVRGALFLPPGEGPFPGVIEMFGGLGGLLEFRSSLLASRGFACLALAYSAYEDLPKFMPTVDLTYFEEAAQFLLRNPKVSGDGVGVVAVCKAAEIALCMASYLPQVQATVCINGTNAVNGNFLTYGNISIEGIPYQIERAQTTHSGAMQLSFTLQDPRKPEYQDCILPIERARGPVLFCVGDKDQNYDSLFFANEALARARKKGKQNVYLRRYPGAGHLLEPPGSPFCPVSQSPFFPLPLMWGGELVPHCTAQETCWREMRDFLHSNLAPGTKSKL
uniref:Bile acid-CoA:amino acid N-acyltransferase n=1 Tax=Xenopus tropicalis TaxID=8364 RepID=A0A6I8QMZ8_XENTR